MECSLIQAALDWDRLPQSVREEYQNHLRACLACRKRVSREAPEKLLFELGDLDLPDDFWLGFWDSLHPKLEQQPRDDSRIRFSLVRWAAVLAVAASLISFQHTVLKSDDPARPSLVLPMQETHHYPLIEQIDNPKAKYYIFQPDRNEKIVMILDPDIEL
jgi:hypothetical protein